MSFPPDPTVPLPLDPELPAEAEGRPLVVLADVTSTLERRIVQAWLDRTATGHDRPDVIELAPSRRRRAGRRTDPRLPARLQRGDDPWVLPVRVAWFPAERGGRRSASWIDVLKLGDPRDPDVLRQHVILARDPARLRIVVGPGASASSLIEAHRTSVEVLSLVDFVTRRAHLALERAEREIRGNRYKVPRFVHEEILGQAEFRDGVMRIAGEHGLAPEIAFARARYYLREIAATHSPFVIDLIANAIHWLYRQGYGAIVYDRDRVREIAELGQRYPIAFLPSHRSNLDRLSLQYLLWENDLPPNHTAAGINMNFFPVGPLIRRTGAFFIRRSFKGNDLYKFVLRSYLDYLVERRFPLEWYLEGGRSRTGKLLPPRYGMLGWVADAVRRNRADDLYLVPTSIAYDQIFDVADYAVEARGGEKPRESIGYVIERIRTLRRRYGNIHVRFADPISIGKEIEVDTDGEVSLDLQKLAFEVMYRIASVTPITPTAIVSIALLAGPAGGSTITEVGDRCRELVACVDRRRLPTTEPLRLDEPEQVRAVLDRLADHGSVTLTGERCSLTAEQAIQAAYYRNMVVHFFVPGAIAEVALAGGAGDITGFWERVGGIRDLLKFEFFFPTREEFHHQIREAMREVDPDWEETISRPGGPEALLEATRPIRAPWSLLPILEAYRIVAEELVDTPGAVDERPFLDACLARGRRQAEIGLVPTEESVSLALFTPALSLARNRDLVEGGEQVAIDRAAFAGEVLAARDAALSLRDLMRSRDVTSV